MWGPTLRNILDDFSNVNVLVQFCEPREVIAIYNHRELFVNKLIEWQYQAIETL